MYRNKTILALLLMWMTATSHFNNLHASNFIKDSRLTTLGMKVLRSSPIPGQPAEIIMLNMEKLNALSHKVTTIRLQSDCMESIKLGLYEGLSQSADPEETQKAIAAFDLHQSRKDLLGSPSQRLFDLYKYASAYPVLIQIPEFEYNAFQPRIATFLQERNIHFSLMFQSYKKSYPQEYTVSREMNGSDYYLRPNTDPFNVNVYDKKGTLIFSGAFRHSAYDKPATDLLLPAIYKYMHDYPLRDLSFFVDNLMSNTSAKKQKVDGRRFWELTYTQPEKPDFSWKFFMDIQEKRLCSSRN